MCQKEEKKGSDHQDINQVEIDTVKDILTKVKEVLRRD